MKKPYDQNLRDAMEEIKPILKKYDCMASVVLASKTHSEYILEPETTWSVCRWEEIPDGPKALRFRSKKADFPSKESQHEATESTVHGIESIKWINKKIHESFSSLTEQLGRHMTITSNVSHLTGEPDSYPGDGL